MKGLHKIGIIMIWFLLAIFMVGCSSGVEEHPVFYTENDQGYATVVCGQVFEPGHWAKQPTNLMATHETLKKVGYANLIAKSGEDSPWWIAGRGVGPLPLKLALEELLSARVSPPGNPWAEKFWLRRNAESNATETEVVLREIQQILFGDATPKVNEQMVIPQLKILLELRLEETRTQETTLAHFQVLRELGFHQSAANIVNGERYGYVPIPIEERQELLKLLNKAESYPSCVFLEDDTK